MTILMFLDKFWHPCDLEWFHFSNLPSIQLWIIVTIGVRVRRSHRQILKINLLEGNKNHLLNWYIYEENRNHEWISKEVVIHLMTIQEDETVQLILYKTSPLQSWERRRIPNFPYKYYLIYNKSHVITVFNIYHYRPVYTKSIYDVISDTFTMPGNVHNSDTRDLKWMV